MLYLFTILFDVFIQSFFLRIGPLKCLDLIFNFILCIRQFLLHLINFVSYLRLLSCERLLFFGFELLLKIRFLLLEFALKKLLFSFFSLISLNFSFLSILLLDSWQFILELILLFNLKILLLFKLFLELLVFLLGLNLWCDKLLFHFSLESLFLGWEFFIVLTLELTGKLFFESCLLLDKFLLELLF